MRAFVLPPISAEPALTSDKKTERDKVLQISRLMTD